MKNLIILIIIAGLSYFAYNVLNYSPADNQPTANQQMLEQEGLEEIVSDIPTTQQGALIKINNQIQDALSEARNAVEQTQNRVSDVINR